MFMHAMFKRTLTRMFTSTTTHMLQNWAVQNYDQLVVDVFNSTDTQK